VPIRTRFKIFYLVLFLSVGVYVPYLALFLIHKEMSGEQLGILLAVIPLISIVLQPVWCILSDLFKVRRLALSIACFGLSLCSLGLGASSGFVGILIFIILSSIMNAPISALSTAIALDFLEANQKRDEYGLLRLWGSIGFSISSILMGVLLSEELIDYMPFIFGGLNALIAIMVFTLPEGVVNQSGNWLGARQRTSFTFSLALFGTAALVLGATLGIGHQYLSVFMQDIQIPGLLIGVTVAMQAIFEIPLMASLPWFLRRWNLATGVMIGVLILPIRWLILALVQDPVWILVAQALHSTAIVSLVVVSVMFVDRQFPTKWRATAQGFFAVALNGVGPSIGLFVAGNIYQNSGIQMVWVMNTFLAVAGCILMALALKIITQSELRRVKAYV
jgi:MFS transporter, PPP family, 3-phenylpropionic acid transporter